MAELRSDETGDMVVVTAVLPEGCRDGLAVTVRGHAVVVTAAGGFEYEVELPPEADVERLRAQLYDRYLELRAPRGPEPEERTVPVRVLR